VKSNEKVSGSVWPAGMVTFILLSRSRCNTVFQDEFTLEVPIGNNSAMLLLLILVVDGTSS